MGNEPDILQMPDFWYSAAIEEYETMMVEQYNQQVAQVLRIRTLNAERIRQALMQFLGISYADSQRTSLQFTIDGRLFKVQEAEDPEIRTYRDMLFVQTTCDLCHQPLWLMIKRRADLGRLLIAEEAESGIAVEHDKCPLPAIPLDVLTAALMGD